MNNIPDGDIDRDLLRREKRKRDRLVLRDRVMAAFRMDQIYRIENKPPDWPCDGFKFEYCHRRVDSYGRPLGRMIITYPKNWSAELIFVPRIPVSDKKSFFFCFRFTSPDNKIWRGKWNSRIKPIVKGFKVHITEIEIKIG